MRHSVRVQQPNHEIATIWTETRFEPLSLGFSSFSFFICLSLSRSLLPPSLSLCVYIYIYLIYIYISLSLSPPSLSLSLPLSLSLSLSLSPSLTRTRALSLSLRLSLCRVVPSQPVLRHQNVAGRADHHLGRSSLRLRAVAQCQGARI